MSKKSGKGWVVAGLAALAMCTAMSAGAAERCRDDKGKFIKCPVAQPAPAAHCRDKTTKKFVKCGAANSEPVPAATGG